MKPDDDAAAATPELVPAIERATHLIGLYLERRTAALGIGQAEAHILARLGRGGSASVGELHDLFGHKRSTLTGVIDRLEARGYVTREINANDRRSFLVSLTGEGVKAAKVVCVAVSELERKIAARVSDIELDGAIAVLSALEGESLQDET